MCDDRLEPQRKTTPKSSARADQYSSTPSRALLRSAQDFASGLRASFTPAHRLNTLEVPRNEVGVISGSINNPHISLVSVLFCSGGKDPPKQRLGGAPSECGEQAGPPANYSYSYSYSNDASRASSVTDTFRARSSASALLSGRRYSILLPSSLIPDRK